MQTSYDQLMQWLCEPEGARLEFKEAKNNYQLDKLVEYCVALANEGGGKIIFGVGDTRPRKIFGSAAWPETGQTEAILHQILSRRIPVEELLLPEGRVVIVHVPSRLPGSAWNIKGSYLKRAGDALVGMTDVELRTVFAETGPDFSAEICGPATLFDLSKNAIDLFRQRWAQKSNDNRKLTWTDAEILTNAELMVDGTLTYAALILFGSRVAVGRYLAQAELIFEYRSSEASGPASDREEYREGFFSWQDTLWAKVNLRNDRQSYQDGLFRMELFTFDEVQVREAVLNAISHRDYRLGGSVFVRQYSKRLEMVSPGGFPEGITQANLLDQQNPRNRRLSETLAKCGLVERSGQGMNLMFETAIKQGKLPPNFSGSAAHEVRLVLDGVVHSRTLVKFLERLSAQTLESFSTEDFLVLDALHRDCPLSPQFKSRLPALVRLAVVEVIGRGKGARYILSRAVYSDLGSLGTYTHRKGLDRNTNKALLERHIDETAGSGAKLDELQQVLPALSRPQIQSILRELRTEGRIVSVGKTKAARWYVGVTKRLQPLE